MFFFFNNNSRDSELKELIQYNNYVTRTQTFISFCKLLIADGICNITIIIMQ